MQADVRRTLYLMIQKNNNMPPLNKTATIISTGQELVCGRSSESNSAFISRLLTDNGLKVRAISILGDDADEISSELLHAAERGGFIIISGGLGPTLDDRTREAVSKAAGLGLELNEDALKNIREMLHSLGKEMSERHRIQAMIPRGALVFNNPIGTACGFCCSIGETRTVAMPGVPEEMQKMFRDHVLPFIMSIIRKNGGQTEISLTRQVNLFGMPESEVNSLLYDMMRLGRNPELGLCVDNSNIKIFVSAVAEDESKALSLIEADLIELQKRLGNALYGLGDETLTDILLRALKKKKWNIAIAESCTGGMIGDMLVKLPGASECFLLDTVAYSNDAKISVLGVNEETLIKYGAVSAQVAEEMALGVCRISGAQVGISTTGIAGPTGGSNKKPVGLVCIGISINNCLSSFTYHFPGNRQQIRERAAGWALNQTRLMLNGDVSVQG